MLYPLKISETKQVKQTVNKPGKFIASSLITGSAKGSSVDRNQSSQKDEACQKYKYTDQRKWLLQRFLNFLKKALIDRRHRNGVLRDLQYL